MTGGRNAATTVAIAPPKRSRFPDLSEFITHREVLYFMVKKSISLRYKQTLIGVLWVVLQPLSMMLVFVIFFGTILDLKSGDIPFPLFIYSALVAWQYFSSSVTEAMGSISREMDLIQRVYFPRLFLPVVPCLTHLIDLAVSLVLLGGMMVIYQVPLSANILALPLFIVVLAMFATGIGVWLATWNVYFHDVPYVVAFILQLLFFMSPIFYEASAVHANWRLAYELNPLAAVIQGFRWSAIGGESPTMALWGSLVVAVTVLVTSLWHFGSKEAEMVSRM